MRTIVVGVDGSPPSLNALRFAAELAGDLHHAELVVVFARHIYLAMPPHVAEDMYRDVLDQAARSVEVAVEAELGDRELRWTLESHEGYPANVLCDVAARTEASFVVIGRSGWSTFHELFLGSVSNCLAHRSDVPVLLVS